MSKSFKKKKKTREQHIEDVLVDLEKDIANFQLTVQKKGKTIQEYVRLLKLTKREYQKLFQENKLLKERINSIGKENIVKKTAKKRQYKVETDSVEEEEQEEDQTESEPKEIREDTLNKLKVIVARKIKEDTKKETKAKPKKKRDEKDF